MSASSARSSLVELIIQCVREGLDPASADWEVRLRDRLQVTLGGPFADGQLITAAYLNFIESRLKGLEDETAKLRDGLPNAERKSSRRKLDIGG